MLSENLFVDPESSDAPVIMVSHADVPSFKEMFSNLATMSFILHLCMCLDIDDVCRSALRSALR
jgi:hypothetical protein